MRNVREHLWDYIVIGSGMGGGTVGYQLARQGASVLFIEKGRSHLDPTQALTGQFAETHFEDREAPSAHHADILATAGRYSETITDCSLPDSPRPFIPFIGAGTGGSSALYGMALERFFPEDFEPAANFPDVGDSSVPARWPVSYNELAPYYRMAEQLYGVRGTPDPLRPETSFNYESPPPMSPCNQALSDTFSARGLRPYQLPMACAFKPGCLTCQGYLCSRGCKKDSSQSVRNAVRDHDAQLLTGCEALRLDAPGDTVQALVCRRNDHELRLQARRYIVCAGALGTPALLLNSTSERWPNGLANDSDQLGRNLMRHLIDLYAVFTRPRPEPTDRVKELAFNDYYNASGQKLGSVQSFGLLPPAPIIARELARDIRRDAGAIAGMAFKLVQPVVGFALGQLLRRSVLLATTLEDLPYPDNRVTLSGSASKGGSPSLELRYTLRDAELARIATMREKMQSVLQPMRYLLLEQAANNERIAHACGTARFGEDPSKSVCDAHQRAHGVTNLYIADSSVFPSSGGINPSLTIAALSLRLAHHLQDTSHG